MVHVEHNNAGSITVLALTCRLRTVPLLALLEQALSSTKCILALWGLVNRGSNDRASRTATSTSAYGPMELVEGGGSDPKNSGRAPCPSG